MKLTKTFKMNDKGYKTDAETLKVIASIVPDAVETNDFSAVIAVMEIGQMVGRIVEMTGKELAQYAA